MFFGILANKLLIPIFIRLLICAPTNSAVDTLLDKLVNSCLFEKTAMKRLVSYTYYNSSSYKMEYDEYCVIPELESYNDMNKKKGIYYIFNNGRDCSKNE